MRRKQQLPRTAKRLNWRNLEEVIRRCKIAREAGSTVVVVKLDYERRYRMRLFSEARRQGLTILFPEGV